MRYARFFHPVVLYPKIEIQKNLAIKFLEYFFTVLIPRVFFSVGWLDVCFSGKFDNSMNFFSKFLLDGLRG